MKNTDYIQSSPKTLTVLVGKISYYSCVESPVRGHSKLSGTPWQTRCYCSPVHRSCWRTMTTFTNTTSLYILIFIKHTCVTVTCSAKQLSYMKGELLYVTDNSCKVFFTNFTPLPVTIPMFLITRLPLQIKLPAPLTDWGRTTKPLKITYRRYRLHIDYTCLPLGWPISLYQ